MQTIESSSKIFGNFTVKKTFVSGGSPVKKYLLSKDDKLYLLRLFDPRFIVSRKTAFDNIKLLYEKGINVQEPIEFGICNNEQNAYMIVEWIDGKSIEDLLDNSTNEEKLNYGVQSGQELRKMHSVNKKSNINLIERYRTKIIKKKQKFQTLGVINEDISKMFEYLENNLYLLENSDTSVIHGDIHIGNIMINQLGQMVFIDLDVCDYGSSWYDLASNSCLLNNDEYYIGLIDGYFGNSIPEDFWRVYTFYGCLHCLDYIQYSMRTDNLGLSHGVDASNNFINTTNQLSGEIPNWYKKSKSKVLRREDI